MSEPYGTLGATVPESDDYVSGGADVPRAFREFSDSLGEGQGAGKLLVVQNTGAAAFKAMSGDVSINASGVTQIGNDKLATGMYQDGSVTRAKQADTAKPVRWYEPLLIEGSETRTNAAYGKLTTPDEIKEVAVPAGSVLLIGYEALWENSKAGKGRAAIFIGANQLKVIDDGATPLTSAAIGGGEGGAGNRIVTCQAGLISGSAVGSYAVQGDIANTGVALGLFANTIAPQIEINGAAKELPKGIYGGLCQVIGLAAGTYNISVQFKSAEGSISAKARRLLIGVIANGS